MIYNIPPICKKMVKLFDGQDVFVDGKSTTFRTQHDICEQPFIRETVGYGTDGMRNCDGHVFIDSGACRNYGYNGLAPIFANFYMTEPVDTTGISKIEFNIVATTLPENKPLLDKTDGVYIVLFRTTETWLFDLDNFIMVQQTPLYTTEDVYNDTPYPLEKVVINVKDINETVYIGFAAQCTNYGVVQVYNTYLGDINAF